MISPWIIWKAIIQPKTEEKATWVPQAQLQPLGHTTPSAQQELGQAIKLPSDCLLVDSQACIMTTLIFRFRMPLIQVLLWQVFSFNLEEPSLQGIWNTGGCRYVAAGLEWFEENKPLKHSLKPGGMLCLPQLRAWCQGASKPHAVLFLCTGTSANGSAHLVWSRCARRRWLNARAGAVRVNFSWPLPNVSVWAQNLRLSYTTCFHSFLPIHSCCDCSGFFCFHFPWGSASQAHTRHLLPAVTRGSLSPCRSTVPWGNCSSQLCCALFFSWDFSWQKELEPSCVEFWSLQKNLFGKADTHGLSHLSFTWKLLTSCY